MTYAPWIAAGVLFLLLVLKGMQLSEAEAEIARLKDQLQRAQGGGTLAAPAPTPALDSAAWQSEVKSLVQQGQKIQAIKLYREKTGIGLKEAKDAVDAMQP
jgi:large subunit ribosomal protein L7/L12